MKRDTNGKLDFKHDFLSPLLNEMVVYLVYVSLSRSQYENWGLLEMLVNTLLRYVSKWDTFLRSLENLHVVITYFAMTA